MPQIRDPIFTVRCRAIIMDEGKILVVRHTPKSSFWAFPGGRLEFGEDIRDCVEREITEELGVSPDIDRFLYAQVFSDNGAHSVEFYFEARNGHEYRDLSRLNGTHAHELADMRWVSPEDDVQILPERIGKDFREGTIGSVCPVFIENFKARRDFRAARHATAPKKEK